MPQTRHLIRHPACAAGSCTVTVDTAMTDAILMLVYTLHHREQIRLPPLSGPGHRDGLWRHTCFELFARHNGEAAYQEYNFSPGGQYAIYQFSSYREGMRAVTGHAPEIAVQSRPELLALDARIPRSALPGGGKGALQLALAAVLEHESEELSYWALHHPMAQADFHHPGSFTLTLG